MMFIFALADRWGEADPRKIADLPDEILTAWRAYLNIVNGEQNAPAAEVPPAWKQDQDDDGFAACLRVLGNG